jgi:c-di-GMP-related signal transduction protein
MAGFQDADTLADWVSDGVRLIRSAIDKPRTTVQKSSVKATTAPPQTCVARQPILDRRGHVFGYELLFRRSATVQSCDIASSDACVQVIVDAMHSIGLDTLASGKRAFLNVTREFLLSNAATLLPKHQVVIELLEDIEVDHQVVEACKALKKGGYTLALDDFTYSESIAELLPLADYVKIDFLAMNTPAARAPVLAAIKPSKPLLLAEKVETPEQVEEAVREGFEYFQGYYFGRPVTREVKRIPGRRVAYAALLAKLGNPDISVFELEHVIKHDASLSHRVLRAVNSSATPLRVEISSIQQAILLLGRDTIRRWGSLWALASMGEGAHPELVTSSIIRARCCELLDATAGQSGTGFLLGICSLLDAILEQPMEIVLQDLPVKGEIRAALLGEANNRRALLDCVIAYERGEWDRSESLATDARLNGTVLPGAYSEALTWARDINTSGKPAR